MQDKLDGEEAERIKEKAHHEGKRTRNRKKKNKVENMEEQPIQI